MWFDYVRNYPRANPASDLIGRWRHNGHAPG
jgi:hypothetical protein